MAITSLFPCIAKLLSRWVLGCDDERALPRLNLLQLAEKEFQDLYIAQPSVVGGEGGHVVQIRGHHGVVLLRWWHKNRLGNVQGLRGDLVINLLR